MKLHRLVGIVLVFTCLFCLAPIWAPVSYMLGYKGLLVGPIVAIVCIGFRLIRGERLLDVLLRRTFCFYACLWVCVIGYSLLCYGGIALPYIVGDTYNNPKGVELLHFARGMFLLGGAMVLVSLAGWYLAERVKAPGEQKKSVFGMDDL